MLGAILSGAVTVAASLLVGNAILLLVGRGRSTAVAPALGISVLLIVCGITVKLPGRGVTAAAFVVAISLIAAVICWRGRRDLPRPTWTAAAVVIGAALVTAIPFAASGRMGILGQGLVNDDGQCGGSAEPATRKPSTDNSLQRAAACRLHSCKALPIGWASSQTTDQWRPSALKANAVGGRSRSHSR